MVIMASSIAVGRVRTTTTTMVESRKMAGGYTTNNRLTETCSLGLKCTFLYQLTPVKSSYPLSSVTLPYRGLKCIAHPGHVSYLSWPLTKCLFLIGSRAHVELTCWKQSRVVRKPVKSNRCLKINQIITVSSVYGFCFVYRFCDY